MDVYDDAKKLQKLMQAQIFLLAERTNFGYPIKSKKDNVVPMLN
jgi:hypothetical protein